MIVSSSVVITASTVVDAIVVVVNDPVELLLRNSWVVLSVSVVVSDNDMVVADCVTSSSEASIGASSSLAARASSQLFMKSKI